MRRRGLPRRGAADQATVDSPRAAKCLAKFSSQIAKARRMSGFASIKASLLRVFAPGSAAREHAAITAACRNECICKPELAR